MRGKNTAIIGLVLSIAAIIVLAGGPLLTPGQGDRGAGSSGDRTAVPPSSTCGAVSAVQFHNEWRAVWEEHVWWTREVIIGILDNANWTDTSVNRLIKVTNDTREMLRPYYGDQADTFYTELVGHFTIAAQIVTGVREGTNVTSLVQDWFANAANLTRVMNAMNPQFWPAGEVNAMWNEHLNLTIQEATAQAQGDYALSVPTFDLIELQGRMMGDLFSNGIMMQFPDQFRGMSCVEALNAS
ncbi:MAG: hypothetical protein ISF22_10810 [Methanomassiliicoccus sp.]|nr:hypothetical protein [Methanomassiliicoccus sp.]